MGLLQRALDAADASLEDALSRLSDEEWALLEARVRSPKTTRSPVKSRRDRNLGKAV